MQRWERFSPFPQQLSAFRGSNADGGGASTPTRVEETWQVFHKGMAGEPVRGDCTAHACSGHSLLLGKRAAFCPMHVYYPGTQLGRALQRGQASGITSASPLFCQGGWISLSNKQEAVWPLPATCLKYLLCALWARDMLGVQWEQDLFSQEPLITESLLATPVCCFFVL